MKLSKWQSQLSITILLIIPPIITAMYIAMFGVNVIYGDQWSFLSDTLSHYYDGSLSLQHIFAQHNEHRIFFPKIVMIGLAIISSYNNLAEMIFSYLLLLFNLVLIYKIYLIGKQWSWKNLMLFIPIVWLVCSLLQWGNLLWGFQIQVYLCVTGFLITILCLNYSKGLDRFFIGSVIGGILSSFSFMVGLMVWPAGFLFILLTERKTSKQVVIWLVMSVLTFITFFRDYSWPLGRSSMLDFFSKPLDAVGYFLLCNGASLGFYFGDLKMISGEIGGLILLMITGFVLYRALQNNILRKNAHYMAFISFVFLSEVMLIVGRGGLGIAQAASSRYVTFTVLWIVSVYCIFLQVLQFNNNTWTRRIFHLFCILLLVGIVIGTIDGFNQGKNVKEQREAMHQSLLSFQTASDPSLSKLFPPGADFVRKWAPFLKQNKLNVFTGGKDSSDEP